MGGRKFIIYTRHCKRCKGKYKTTHKKSKICKKCYKPRGALPYSKWNNSLGRIIKRIDGR